MNFLYLFHNKKIEIFRADGCDTLLKLKMTQWIQK